MRLKSLRLKGFKSFADDTVLNFNEQVIGVVGPNGSGKSNVVDAIRWVLGEQKGKELRLQNMGDVIFNGSKKRKGAKRAEVTIEFENDKGILPTEFSTVSISRVLYKSGESEYRLNDTKCRLKDITNLLVDTGIGSNSYAIIELGMVDDILSDKDRARRKMFEQAAGISKYKKRKRETLLKLKSTADDLERVEDLLFEIEKNLKTLEKQAKRARKHSTLKEDYKELSVQLALIQTKTYREDYTAIKQQIATVQGDLTRNKALLAKEEAALEENKRTTLTNEQEVSAAQRDLNGLTEEVRKLESEKNMLKQRVDFIRENTKKLDRSIQQLAEQNIELQDKLEAYEKSICEAEHQEKMAKEKQIQAKSELEEREKAFVSAKAGLDAQLSEKQKLDAEKYEYEKQKAVRANNLETLESNLRNARQEQEARSFRLKELIAVAETSQKEVQRMEQALKKMEMAEEQRKETVEELRKTILKYSQDLAQTGREMDSCKNEYDLLKSMVDQLEGFPESIKYLNKHLDSPPPLLTDVIDVEEQYRMAVEQYLEPHLNTYIVRDIQHAAEAISLLSGAQKGTARFFILSELPRVSPCSAGQKEWVSALDQIDTDEQYLPLFEYLLNGVFFVKEEPLAMEMLGDDIVLIQPQRGTIRSRSTLSGGSVGLFAGKKIGRKKQLDKLDKKLKKYRRQAELIESKKAQANQQLLEVQRIQDAGKLKKMAHALSEEKQKSVRLVTRRNLLEQDVEKGDKYILELSQRIETLRVEVEGEDDTRAQLEERISALDRSIQSQGGDVQRWNEELTAVSSHYNELNIQYFKAKNKVELLTKEGAYFKSRVEEIKHMELDQHQQLQNSTEELEEVTRRIAELEKEITLKYEHKQIAQSQLREKESLFYEIRDSIAQKEEGVKQLRSQVNQLHVRLADLKEKYNQIRLQLNSIGERINIEFGLSIDYLMQKETPTEIAIEELMEKVARIKQRLDNFGEVNPLAMHAYDEIKKRYETIVSQRQDILDAKGSLETTIEEIEKKATLLFLEAFGEVKEYFRAVFRSLFTEDDDCDLLLLDPENPLQSDIEIIAKPKGKRPKTLSQLSGGEKTLTATALLFSLYLLKPAPFCIFDEVDAPLDDANILKFNNIISEFSKHSQFVIVTHNKLTMAEVDILYGVFMQENGISAVSEVDFRKLSHQPLIENV